MARLNLLSVLLVAVAFFISGSEATWVVPSFTYTKGPSVSVAVSKPVVRTVVVSKPVVTVSKPAVVVSKPVVVAPTTVVVPAPVVKTVSSKPAYINVRVVKVGAVPYPVKATTNVATTKNAAASTSTTNERGPKPAAAITLPATTAAVPKTAATATTTAATTSAAAPQYATILAAAQAAKLDTLVAAIKAANLVEPVSSANTTWTVFAPTNEAFTAALTKLGLTADKLLADKDTLTKVLQFHVVPGSAALSSTLKDGLIVSTALPGKSLKINVKDGKVSVTGGDVTANVVKADVTAGKSVVHVIDAVLLPPK